MGGSTQSMTMRSNRPSFNPSDSIDSITKLLRQSTRPTSSAPCSAMRPVGAPSVRAQTKWLSVTPPTTRDAQTDSSAKYCFSPTWARGRQGMVGRRLYVHTECCCWS